MGNWAGFGQAVTFDEPSTRQFLKCLLHFYGQGRGAAYAGFD